MWDDVLSGKYEVGIEQKKAELEKQLPALEAKIPKYSGEELNFMLYGKDPRLEEYNKAQSEYDQVKEKAQHYNGTFAELQLTGKNKLIMNLLTSV